MKEWQTDCPMDAKILYENQMKKRKKEGRKGGWGVEEKKVDFIQNKLVRN